VKKQESAFIGKITAGVTHEYMNVLATIRETSGLMEDLLSLSQADDFPYREKFSKALSTIRSQVDRGTGLTEKLNAFAHNMDRPSFRVVIDDLLVQVILLMQHSSRLCNIELLIDHTHRIRPSPVLLSDPFNLQLILASCLEYCMANTASGGAIMLQTGHVDEGVAIRCVIAKGLNSARKTDDFASVAAGLEEACHALEARLQQIDSTNQHGLTLILPA